MAHYSNEGLTLKESLTFSDLVKLALGAAVVLGAWGAIRTRGTETPCWQKGFWTCPAAALAKTSTNEPTDNFDSSEPPAEPLPEEAEEPAPPPVATKKPARPSTSTLLPTATPTPTEVPPNGLFVFQTPGGTTVTLDRANFPGKVIDPIPTLKANFVCLGPLAVKNLKVNFSANDTNFVGGAKLSILPAHDAANSVASAELTLNLDQAKKGRRVDEALLNNLITSALGATCDVMPKSADYPQIYQEANTKLAALYTSRWQNYRGPNFFQPLKK